MSTPQSIATVAPRLRIGLGTALIAVGVLVAVAVTVVIVALTGTSRAPSAIPATHYAPLIQYRGTGTPPATRYLGTAQVRPHDMAARPVSGGTNVSSAARVTSSAIQGTPSTAVGPNPDERVLQPAAPQPGPTTNYPGHY